MTMEKSDEPLPPLCPREVSESLLILYSRHEVDMACLATLNQLSSIVENIRHTGD